MSDAGGSGSGARRLALGFLVGAGTLLLLSAVAIVVVVLWWGSGHVPETDQTAGSSAPRAAP